MVSSSALHYKWYLSGTEIENSDTCYIIASDTGAYIVEVFNESGCSTKSEPFNVITGADETGNNNKNNFYIIPNPALSNIFVKSDFEIGGLVILKIKNILGCEICRISNTFFNSKLEFVFYVSPYSQGVYFIEIQYFNHIYIQKFVKA